MKKFLVTFSGLDGSGKSTQIANLRAALSSWGQRSELLTFWDDAVVLTRYREQFVHVAYKSERGVGAPGRPVNRRDKNVRRWYLTVSRHALYLLDAINLRRILARASRCDAAVIIVDRYIYDELANLPLKNPVSAAWARLIYALVPKPDVAFLLDADPEAARARKPEYPVEFMRQCRKSYFELANLLGGITVVPPLAITEAERRITDAVSGLFSVSSATAA
jgi:thymidylate kinase